MLNPQSSKKLKLIIGNDEFKYFKEKSNLVPKFLLNFNLVYRFSILSIRSLTFSLISNRTCFKL
jgi:hypothetical protein